MNLYSKSSDTELVSFLKKGDQVAYTEIFERYKAILYKHAFRLLNDEEEANDVIQDLFLVLWQKRESIHLTTSLSSYLYGAVRNRIFDIITHQKVVAKYLYSIKNFVEHGDYITDDYVRGRELAKIIEREINALPPKMREVFELSRQGDLSYKEIGQRLNISDKTVKQQVHNAVKILKVKINTYLSLFPFL